MSEPTSAPVPAAWYPDPAGTPRQRWWDGTQWTDHYQEPYSGAGVALKAPEGTNIWTPWIWLVTLLPIISLVALLFIPWGSMFSGIDPYQPETSSLAVMSIFFSPAYIIATIGSYVILGFSVWFAYLDYATLKQRGVPKPFHWAFAFLGTVYPIGRSVVVKRRTGHGSAPMWAAIGVLVLSFVISIAISVMMMNSMFSLMETVVPTR